MNRQSEPFWLHLVPSSSQYVYPNVILGAFMSLTVLFAVADSGTFGGYLYGQLRSGGRSVLLEEHIWIGVESAASKFERFDNNVDVSTKQNQAGDETCIQWNEVKVAFPYSCLA